MAELRGGDKFEAALAGIAARLTSAKSVKVGFLEKSTYPDGTKVPMIAAIQEFGAPRVGIPPRPFFRRMIAAKKSEWGPAIGQLLIDNNNDAALSLNQAGAAIAGQLQQSIADLTDPPLSKTTLMLRKMFGNAKPNSYADVIEARRRVAAGESVAGVSTKPLVHSGNLISSVSHEVQT